MKILLVEDDEKKRNRLLEFLAERYSGHEVETAFSLNSGVKKARDNAPDLVLLDMTLPNFDVGPQETGGRMHNFGGKEFLRQMDRFDLELDVIVVTQFETFGKGNHLMGLAQLDEQLQDEHEEHYRGVVYYHASIHDWQDKLEAKINEVTQSGK